MSLQLLDAAVEFECVVVWLMTTEAGLWWVWVGCGRKWRCEEHGQPCPTKIERQWLEKGFRITPQRLIDSLRYMIRNSLLMKARTKRRGPLLAKAMITDPGLGWFTTELIRLLKTERGYIDDADLLELEWRRIRTA